MSIVHVLAATAVTMHAVLGRREVPAVIGWVGLVWLAPVVGSALYFVFGVNRIRRAGAQLWSQQDPGTAYGAVSLRDELPVHLLECSPAMDEMVRLGAIVTGLPLRHGNHITALVDGDEAYPAMLDAISGAQQSVLLASYIFDTDRVGVTFSAALTDAHRRGVLVRVLIDDVGARYSRPPMPARLRALGVPVATFLPTRGALFMRYANLRNHRKLLLVDGRIGFTGGMNIREGHQRRLSPAAPVRCLHFRVDGPIVTDMLRAFAQDWAFTTGETLTDVEHSFRADPPAGDVTARSVLDGPDSDIENMPEIILGALAAARRRIAIVTPYFLPDARILSALRIAALRGLSVDLVIPSRNNVRVMDWATMPQMITLLESGCRVWRTPPPFDHTKLFVVDGVWSLIGSTNWDARSLRLNFEHNLECYDATLAQQLEMMVTSRITNGTPLTIRELHARTLPVRVRDGVARLLSPYL